MMHQNNILIAAVESSGCAADFRAEVDRIFGSPFSSTTSPPGIGQRVRRDGWAVNARQASAKFQSQVEKRIVDVALGNVLTNVHRLSVSPQKRATWLTLVDLLTGRTGHWHGLSTQMTSLIGKHNPRSGYFWASMLAATSDAITTIGSLPTAAQIQAHAVALNLSRVRNPRARSGNRVQTINEMQQPLVVRSAANHIANALAAMHIPPHEAHLMLTVAGAAVSADLWRHPAAVRHLLIPTVASLRGRYGQVFSLDNPTLLTEDLLMQELGLKWQTRAAW